jgi:hypothetical protein
MISIKKLIKHTVAYARLTPEEADLYHRYFLEIMTPDEEGEFSGWTAEDPARDFLFFLICNAQRNDNGFLVTRMIKKQANASARWNHFKSSIYRYFDRKPSTETQNEIV